MVLNVKQDCLSALILISPLEKGLMKAKSEVFYRDLESLMEYIFIRLFLCVSAYNG